MKTEKSSLKFQLFRRIKLAEPDCVCVAAVLFSFRRLTEVDTETDIPAGAKVRFTF